MRQTCRRVRPEIGQGRHGTAGESKALEMMNGSGLPGAIGLCEPHYAIGPYWHRSCRWFPHGCTGYRICGVVHQR
jgi:hypothetical protein